MLPPLLSFAFERRSRSWSRCWQRLVLEVRNQDLLWTGRGRILASVRPFSHPEVQNESLTTARGNKLVLIIGRLPLVVSLRWQSGGVEREAAVVLLETHVLIGSIPLHDESYLVHAWVNPIPLDILRMWQRVVLLESKLR